MPTNKEIFNGKLNALADRINSKAGASGQKDLDEMYALAGTLSKPTGTVSITQNGTVDVTQYASAAVNVPTGAALLDKTVTFKSDDVDIAIHSVKSGNGIVAPVQPSKSGYVFKGWGDSAAATTYKSFPYTPSGSAEDLYAVWIAASRASVIGLGNSSPTSQVYTRDSDFPTSFDEWTDSNGNIFVKIPTMYRKIDNIISNQITAFTMATAKINNNYQPYSVFVKPNGDVMPYVCIGKYCSNNTILLDSKALSPTGMPIGTARTAARANGDGYQQYDWQFQKLFQDLVLLIGQKIDFQNGSASIREYIGVSDLSRAIYVDGVTGNSGTWAVCSDPTKYVDNATASTLGYTAAGYSQPTQSGEISKLGYDAAVQFFNFPTERISNSNYNTYYCDGYDYYTSGERPVSSAVGRIAKDDGVWKCQSNGSWEGSAYARLCYRPLSETI